MITERKPSLFKFFPYLSKNEFFMSLHNLPLESGTITLEQVKMIIKKTCEMVASDRYHGSSRDAFVKVLAVGANQQEDVKKILEELAEQKNSPRISGTAAGVLAMAKELESSKKSITV